MTKAQMELVVFMAELISEQMIFWPDHFEKKQKLDGLIKIVKGENEYIYNVKCNKF